MVRSSGSSCQPGPATPSDRCNGTGIGGLFENCHHCRVLTRASPPRRPRTGDWFDVAGINLKSSFADLIRASTSLFRAIEGVDGRAKPAKTKLAARFPPLFGPWIFAGQP